MCSTSLIVASLLWIGGATFILYSDTTLLLASPLGGRGWREDGALIKWGRSKKWSYCYCFQPTLQRYEVQCPTHCQHKKFIRDSTWQGALSLFAACCQAPQAAGESHRSVEHLGACEPEIAFVFRFLSFAVLVLASTRASTAVIWCLSIK